MFGSLAYTVCELHVHGQRLSLSHATNWLSIALVLYLSAALAAAVHDWRAQRLSADQTSSDQGQRKDGEIELPFGDVENNISEIHVLVCGTDTTLPFHHNRVGDHHASQEKEEWEENPIDDMLHKK